MVHVFWKSLSCHDIFVELGIFNWKALCSIKWTKCTGNEGARGSASAGTDTLLVSEGRYFLLPASFFIVSPFSHVLACYALQHEWKPTIVPDLNLKSKVVNSSALALWNCYSGESLSLCRCYCEALCQHQGHTCCRRWAEDTWRMWKPCLSKAVSLEMATIIQTACYVQELCTCRSHSFIWTFFLIVLCASSDECEFSSAFLFSFVALTVLSWLWFGRFCRQGNLLCWVVKIFSKKEREQSHKYKWWEI